MSVMVFGATGSLGQALCQKLAERGQTLVLCGRDKDELALMQANLQLRYGTRCHFLVVDLADPRFFSKVLRDALAEAEQLFLVAGEDTPLATPLDYAALMQVNAVAPGILMESAALVWKARGSGLMVAVGSVAGERGRASNYPYGSSKAAVGCFADGLRHRLHGTGIHVMTVKPGFIDGPLTYGKLRGFMARLVASPERVADEILRAADRRCSTLYTPWFWRWIMVVIRAVPDRIFVRTSL